MLFPSSHAFQAAPPPFSLLQSGVNVTVFSALVAESLETVAVSILLLSISNILGHVVFATGSTVMVA